MSNKLHNPHDLFFRNAMSDLRVAEDFFRYHLPKKILDIIDLKTLKLQSGSFISDKLREKITDLLYLVECKDGSDTPAYLYLLMEHQNTPQKHMPFRILQYMCEIMNRHLREHHILPIIFPIVFYNGKMPYNYSCDIYDLFANHKQLAKSLFLKPFHLIDIGQVVDEEIRTHRWSGVMELMMKHVYARDLAKYFKSMLKPLNDLLEQNAHDYVNTIFTYVFNAGNISDESILDLTEESKSSLIGGKMATLAEKLIARGRREGISKGISKGMSKGMAEGKKSVALKMYKMGMEPEVIEQATGVVLSEILQ